MNGKKDFGKLHKKNITNKVGKKTTVWVKGDEQEPEKKRAAKKPEMEGQEGEDPNTHDAIAKELAPVIHKHKKTFEKTIGGLKKDFKGANVYGRVKDLESATEKVFIKRKAGRDYNAKDIQDLTGMRIERDNVKDVLKDVALIKKKYRIISEDDYISKPKIEGYRSYHVIAQDDSGKIFEVQLRTANMTKWADWCHNVYKPHTKLQAQVAKKHSEEISKYAIGMSHYFEAKDNGEEAMEKIPPCTHRIKAAFGCIPL